MRSASASASSWISARSRSTASGIASRPAITPVQQWLDVFGADAHTVTLLAARR